MRGYFQWIILDNFEWGAGYTNRYGLVYVDFKTEKRTPKLSAPFYRRGDRSKHGGVRLRGLYVDTYLSSRVCESCSMGLTQRGGHRVLDP